MKSGMTLSVMPAFFDYDDVARLMGSPGTSTGDRGYTAFYQPKRHA